MFQTLFPQLPEFQGRQVVTLHNQRDFIFLRRHRYIILNLMQLSNGMIADNGYRYAFRSDEKVSLQEIGPRFTLKLRWLKKGIPAVHIPSGQSKPLEFDVGDDDTEQMDGGEDHAAPEEKDKENTTANKMNIVPPTEDEFEWEWKPELETTRRTFFL
jgi:ribosome production factor 1